MMQIGPYLFKQAESDSEFQSIHRLNHQTFAEEIPQHAASDDGTLVDKFHEKNRYWIALKNGELVGMISAHDRPPFSITSRLPDPCILEQPGIRPIEIRLLAIVPEERKSPVMAGLVWLLYDYTNRSGHTHFLISGVVEQQGMYEHLGFEALGPAVGVERASFVPMWLPVQKLAQTMGRSIRLWQRRLQRG